MDWIGWWEGSEIDGKGHEAFFFLHRETGSGVPTLYREHQGTQTPYMVLGLGGGGLVELMGDFSC